MHATYEEAGNALNAALLDAEHDHGAAAAQNAHSDIVRAIAADCTPEVAAELLRREGVGA